MKKTGLIAFWKNYDRSLYLKAAQLADELGYDSFWVPEGWGYEVFQLLTEMAMNTEKIKLGTGIVNVFSRSPGLLAMSAATLDEISGGRFILGLGTSGKRVIEGLHAREFKKPLTHVRDAIRVVRALLAGEDLHSAGAKLGDYRPFTLEMNPTRPRVPIYVAALKQKSITSIGELADGWIPAFWPYRDLEKGRQWIAEGAAKAGRDPAEIATAPFTNIIPMGGDMATKTAKDIVAFYVGGMGDYYKELLTGFGFGDECDTIAATYRDKATRRDAWKQVTDEMMEALTITGDGPTCIAELDRRREFGIHEPLVMLPPNVPWPMVEAFIRVMAPAQ